MSTKKGFAGFSIVILLITFFYNLPLKAQSTAAPFLNDHPSALAEAMGGAGAAYTDNDPLHNSFNPANIGFMSRESNFGFGLYPVQHQDNQPGEIGAPGETGIHNFGFNAGYNFGEIFKGANFSGGIGFVRQNVDYEEHQIIPHIFHHYASSESASTILIGGLLDYYLKLGIGFGFKFVNSNLLPFKNSQESKNGDAFALDAGLLLSVPIIKDMKLSDKINFNLDGNLGYSILNLSDGIDYGEQVNPLPRMASLGYSLNGTVNMMMDGRQIKAVDLLFTGEARDLLVSRDSTGINYQGPLGDIRFWGDLIPTERTKVESIIGLKAVLYETLGIGAGWQNYKIENGISSTKLDMNTLGFYFSTSGLTKMGAGWTDLNWLKFMAKHIELRFVYTIYNEDFKRIYYSSEFGAMQSAEPTFYRQFTLAVKNLELW